MLQFVVSRCLDTVGTRKQFLRAHCILNYPLGMVVIGCGTNTGGLRSVGSHRVHSSGGDDNAVNPFLVHHVSLTRPSGHLAHASGSHTHAQREAAGAIYMLG